MFVVEVGLARAIAILFGALLALLGAVMVFGLDFSADAYGSIALVWTGLAIALAGRNIRRSDVLLERPRSFFAACVFGISSSAGLYKTILTGDTVGAIGLIPLQAIALYALWRTFRR